MRVKRVKKANRILTFYRYHYGYLPPYSALLDGTFCQAALQNKINLREQLPKYLGAPLELAVTNCVLDELEKLGPQLHGALVVARQFEVTPCPHKPLRTAAECLKHLARRSKRKEHAKYFVGTQDDDLLQQIREIAGVPLMSIRFNTVLLEKPSVESISGAEKVQPELQRVQELKKQILGEPENLNRRKRKGPKGPNPLSCKKKKGEQSEDGKKKKRKRKKKKFEKSDAEEKISE